jgi:uncharacterized protein YukE
VTTFQVDLSLLDSTTGDLESFERFIDHKLAELDRVVAALHVTWTGQADARGADRDAACRSDRPRQLPVRR